MTETNSSQHSQNFIRYDYRQVKFHISASTLAQCPADSLREIAFVGRSNAGKSSAINALTEQKSLARTSKTPGRTQLLNFFSLAENTYLVDLPGFGYAKVAAKIKLKWQQQLEQYLEKRRVLQGLVLLTDIRHPLKEFDLQMIQWAINARMPIHILLTKADKLKRGAAGTALLSTKKNLAEMGGDISIQLFSSLSGDGVKDLAKKLNSWFNESAEQTD